MPEHLSVWVKKFPDFFAPLRLRLKNIKTIGRKKFRLKNAHLKVLHGHSEVASPQPQPVRENALLRTANTFFRTEESFPVPISTVNGEPKRLSKYSRILCRRFILLAKGLPSVTGHEYKIPCLKEQYKMLLKGNLYGCI